MNYNTQLLTKKIYICQNVFLLLQFDNMQKTKIPSLNILKINHRISGLSDVRVDYYIILIVTLVMEVWSFVHIYLLGLAFDKLIRLNETKDINGFYWILGYYMGGHAVASLVQTYLVTLGGKIFDQNDSLIQKNSLAKIITYPLWWHSKQSAGNKYKMIGEGANASSNLMTDTIDILVILFNIVISLGFLVWLNPWFIILVIFSVGLTLTTNLVLQPKIRSLSKETSQINEDVNGKGFESLNNIYLIKSVDKMANILAPFNDLINNILIKFGFRRVLVNWRMGINSFTVILINLTYLIIGSNMLLSGVAVFSLIYSGYRYLSGMNQEIIRLSKLLVNITINEVKVNRFLEVFDLNPEPIMSGQKELLDSDSFEELEVKNLDFSYPEIDEKNLKNISLSIKKGEKIGFVGSSGSGKSTITKLISGLYKPTNGQIKVTFGGKTCNLFELDSTKWHDRQFMVSQDSEMFSASMKDNITLFDNSITKERLDKAIQIAQLEELVETLPKGLETQIGEKGYKLSGGQRQRVGIARALVHDYELICLDEATSALDSQTENNFQSALEDNWKDQTLIIVAHRFSTLRNVDRIYVFENGNIIENGSFESLVNKGGKFAKLWELQQKQIEGVEKS